MTSFIVFTNCFLLVSNYSQVYGHLLDGSCTCEVMDEFSGLHLGKQTLHKSGVGGRLFRGTCFYSLPLVSSFVLIRKHNQGKLTVSWH